jgi:hypothetical protein
MRIDQIRSVGSFPEKIKNVPPNYPDYPQVGKISLLFNFNFENLWHQFSPYTSGDNIFGIFPNKQPFIYRYPDQGQESMFKKLPAFVKTLAAAGNFTQDTTDDLVRVSKFSISPQGILYTTKQFALQRMQRFDETRIYNPLSPILATIQPLTLGLGNRPMRHIEGGLLGGSLNSITSTIGINFMPGFSTPSSTVGSNALSRETGKMGKGLIRGDTAADASTNLKSQWQGSSQSPVLGVRGLLSSIGSSFMSFFGGTPKQSAKYRSDEGTYEIMSHSQKKLDYYGTSGQTIIPIIKYDSNKRYANVLSTDMQRMFEIAVDNETIAEFKNKERSELQDLNTQLKKIIADLNRETI